MKTLAPAFCFFSYPLPPRRHFASCLHFTKKFQFTIPPAHIKKKVRFSAPLRWIRLFYIFFSPFKAFTNYKNINLATVHVECCKCGELTCSQLNLFDFWYNKGSFERNLGVISNTKPSEGLGTEGITKVGTTL